MKQLLLAVAMMVFGCSDDPQPDPQPDASTAPTCRASHDAADDARCLQLYSRNAQAFTCEDGADPQHFAGNCYLADGLMCCLPE